MASSSDCPVCHEPITLPAAATPSRLACPACGVRLTTSEQGGLVVEAIRPAVAPNVATVPKPPPKLDDAEDEWDDEIPGQQRWLRQRHRRDAALRKVKAPAIFLQVAGILMILGSIIFAILAVFLLTLSDNQSEKDAESPMAIIFAVGSAGSLLIGIANIIAGRRMKVLRSYNSVLGIVITTLILGAVLCVFLALVPIWPLVVLVNSDVKTAFDIAEKKLAKPKGRRDEDETTDEP
jgi:hypothetical protein